MRQRHVPSRAGEHGFTLIEVMVAATILLVGVLGTFVMLDGAQKTLRENNGRVAGTNLARELVEHARSLAYDQLTPAKLEATIRPRVAPGAGGTSPTSGLPWRVERRGVVYTVAVSVCAFDDPKDGIVTDPALKAPNACPTPAPITGVTTVERNPDDFRRVQVVLSWRREGQARQTTQTSLIVNPSGGLGPRITALTRLDKTTGAPVGPEVQAGPEYLGSTCPDGSTYESCPVVTFRATSRLAATLHWQADDGQRGDAPITDGTNWEFKWPLGRLSSSENKRRTVDGAYTMSVQAFSGVGVPGEASVVTVLVNRRAPLAPATFLAGHNTRRGVVELRWTAVADQDIRQYRVWRDGTAVCTSKPARATECTDSPPTGTSSFNYTVKAVDLQNMADPLTLREGAGVSKSIGSAVSPPKAPTNVQFAPDNGSGLPRLQWTQPAKTGDELDVAFFRIYRTGATGLWGRYDRTLTTDPQWSDSMTPAVGTQYWVTAVDERMNESADSNVISWSGVTA